MPKPPLQEPYRTLESQVIATLLTGLHQYRVDLDYPQSQSDMQACVRNLFCMFSIERRLEPFSLPIEAYDDTLR